MSQQILFVDDEPFFAQSYVDKLKEAGYDVVLKDSAAGGLQYLKSHAERITLLVLDFMMPTPQGISPAETDDGLSAGRWFLREARSLMETRRLPVVVLTNRGAEAVKTIVEQDLLFDMNLVRVCQKTHTPAFYLPTIVGMMIR